MKNRGLFSRAFTLVELLVVIAIIGILAAMLLAVLSGVVNSAKVARAKLEMSSIVTAIQGYDSAYGRFPVSAAVQNANSDFTYGGSLLAAYAAQIGPGNYTTDNSEVIAILMSLTNYPGGGWTVNTNYQRNPQRTIFLNARMSGDAQSPGVGTDLVYRDPWGNPYVITMDLNYDELCEDAFYKSPIVSVGGLNGLILQPDGNYAFRGTVMVWSAGPNKKIDPTDPANDHENRDNVLIWK